jgi:hypothetical protein
MTIVYARGRVAGRGVFIRLSKKNYKNDLLRINDKLIPYFFPDIPLSWVGIAQSV